jgi:Domain of unknown function (DUF4159)
MPPRTTLAAVLLALLAGSGLYAFANRWAKYEREMQDPVNDPPDANVPADFVFARLRYRSPYDGRRFARWGTDANKSDYQFMIALRRLSRVNARSLEEIVDIDSDDIYNYPFLYGVKGGYWVVSEEQGARLRNYLLRGGFLVFDDFHNEQQWAQFMEGVRQALPDKDGQEIPDGDPIFHVVHDLTHRIQVSGYNIVRGNPYEDGGIEPHWRAVRDDKGRIVVAAWHNQDLGDAWEWADAPEYPEPLALEAFQVGVNYVVYSMTH